MGAALGVGSRLLGRADDLEAGVGGIEVVAVHLVDVVRIPSYALLEGGRVLVVEDDELVSVDVETGLRNWEYTEITAGLEPGDRIVVSLDRMEVRAGASVRVTDEVMR